MLRIRYLGKDQLAELSVEAPTAAWLAIRRTCEDKSDEVISQSGTSLTMPWWAFLSCRRALALVLRQHHMQVEYLNGAREQLKAAKARYDAYTRVESAPKVDRTSIAEFLLERGFSEDRPLKDYQLRNVQHLLTLPAGASFSVPGAGKTTEALALFALKRTEDTRILVVAPKNAFVAWEEQLAECLPDADFQFVRLQGGAAAIQRSLRDNPKAVLITYHQLPTVIDDVAAFMAAHPTFMILDESHRMKRGNEGRNGRAVLNLSHLPVSKLILSGTPMPNTISDLVPQFDFLYPEVRASDEDARALIQPIYARTTKEELGLPPLIRRPIPVQMSPAQMELYELLRSEEKRQLSDIRPVERMALRRIGRSVMKLLQVTSNPALLARDALAYPDVLGQVLAEGGSPKIDYVCDRVRQLASRGQKVVVWSTFVQNVEIVAQRLSDVGSVFIHGGVEAGSEEAEDTREYRLKQFHDDDDTMVLVGNPAACGEGISLHKVCHHAIYLDRNYNAAQYLQSEDRIHRLGLPPEVMTYVEIVTCPGTVDDSVNRRLIEKTRAMAEVLKDRSLNIEPTAGDPDNPEDVGLNDKDVDDYLQHLRE